MTEDTQEDHEDHEDWEGHAYDPHGSVRETAPQSPYTNRQVGIGFAIALAGIFLVFVVPILLA